MRAFLLLLLLAQAMPAHAADPAFWWGVGNASFQVEGEPADSDWSRWVKNPKNVLDGSNADRDNEFWRKPEKELDLAQKLGAKMFRLSIAWERVEPSPDHWDEAALNHYEAILIGLRKRGIEPLVTLHHFVLPAWLAEKGGLTAPDFADHFSRYALKVVRRLSRGPAHVRWWMTFNEPMILVFAGYITGEWPPNLKNLSAAAQAEAGLARAHLKAMQKIRSAGDLPADLQFGVATHWRDFQADRFGFLNPVIARIADWLFNRQFVNSVLTGRITIWLPGGWPVLETMPLPAKGASLDYFGMNYYGRSMVHLQRKPPFLRVDDGDGPRNDLGWVMYPEGLGHALRDAYGSYRLPILISENGVADVHDTFRPKFLRDHIAQIREARKQGIPVLGYLHWTLTDNFEWANGFAAHFGLVGLDPATGRRAPRPSFAVYRDLIRQGMAETP